MIYAPIELEQHPGGLRCFGGEVAGLLDEVGEIQASGEGLLKFEGGEIGFGQGYGVDSVSGHLNGA